MFQHHIRNAWRAIRHKKFYTLINVAGLSIGLCACMIIFLIARYDLGFDRFHPDADRIYRIVGDIRMKGGENFFLNCPFPQASALEHEIPGFEQQVGFHTFGSLVTIPAEKGKPATDFDIHQPGGWATSCILTGPSFFSLFPHQWIAGRPDVLAVPNRVVLSERAAARYFGALPVDQVIGKTVIYNDSLPVTVAGIVKDWEGLTDLGYTSFISIGTAVHTWVRQQFPTDDWASLQPHQSQAFVKLSKGVTAAQVNAALAAFVKRENPLPMPGASGLRFYLQPLREMHYSSTFHVEDTGDDFRRAYLPLLYALMGVAGFILLLAIINFINLSTAQSLQRVKEVGIRKVMGSSRKGLITQFVLETFLVTSFSVLLALVLTRPAIRLFSDYIPSGVHFDFTLDTALFLLAIILFTTFAAGLYPARLLSSYLPVVSLKGSVDQLQSGGARLRRGLIVFQFTISLFFIIGSLVIGRQVQYMRSSDKGFKSDGVLVINAWRPGPDKMRLLAEGIRSVAGVQEVVRQGNAPMGWAHAGTALDYRDGTKPVLTHDVMVQHGGPSLLPFYGMPILAGRNLSVNDSAREFIINKTYAEALGFVHPADAVGRLLYHDSMAYAIVGVVADFHQSSFREAIKPLVIWNDPRHENSLGVKLALSKDGDAKAVMSGIEKVWKGVFPKTPFGAAFYEDLLVRLYAEESNTAFLMEAAMIITLCISCFGLFGLALFTVRRREKEIGIRKVLGATIGQISVLLSRDFLALVVLALLISSPIAWYLADVWLRDYAYRASMTVWVLFEAGFAAVAVSLLTVGFLALRAARRNPVEILRRE